jgi:hypothetical protein
MFFVAISLTYGPNYLRLKAGLVAKTGYSYISNQNKNLKSLSFLAVYLVINAKYLSSRLKIT